MATSISNGDNECVDIDIIELHSHTRASLSDDDRGASQIPKCAWGRDDDGVTPWHVDALSLDALLVPQTPLLEQSSKASESLPLFGGALADCAAARCAAVVEADNAARVSGGVDEACMFIDEDDDSSVVLDYDVLCEGTSGDENDSACHTAAVCTPPLLVCRTKACVQRKSQEPSLKVMFANVSAALPPLRLLDAAAASVAGCHGIDSERDGLCVFKVDDDCGSDDGANNCSDHSDRDYGEVATLTSTMPPPSKSTAMGSTLTPTTVATIGAHAPRRGARAKKGGVAKRHAPQPRKRAQGILAAETVATAMQLNDTDYNALEAQYRAAGDSTQVRKWLAGLRMVRDAPRYSNAHRAATIISYLKKRAARLYRQKYNIAPKCHYPERAMFAAQRPRDASNAFVPIANAADVHRRYQAEKKRLASATS